ncbi:MAG: HU family DNA-binding protein [Firmicutes bacterium]|nr:HU family DNA-binding protein [Bacillota bacterium]MBR3392702.1 HU family DNA-binding protein [Bacillota bacterium]
MNKTQFIKQVAEAAEVSNREAAKVVNAALDLIIQGVKKDGSVTFPGFGTFETKTVPARTGEFRGKKYSTKAHKAPAFHAGANFKEEVK